MAMSSFLGFRRGSDLHALPFPGPGPRRAETQQGGLGYLRALDGLRGLSILPVIAIHMFWQVCPGGWVGVDLFFVLSGFLITRLLLQEWERYGRLSLPQFYVRRGLRLMPALLVFLAFCWIYTAAGYPGADAKVTRKGIVSALGYFANWRIFRHPTAGDILAHTWSLSIEQQFYFVWPVLLAGMLWLGLRRRTLAAAVLGGIFLAASLRGWMWHHTAKAFPEVYMRLATRADTLLVGCLTALLVSWRLVPRGRWGRAPIHLAAIGAIAYLVWIFWHVSHWADRLYYGEFTLIAVAAAVLIVSLLHQPPRLMSWVFESFPLVWLGRLSYSIYLWHVGLIHLAWWWWPGLGMPPSRWIWAFQIALSLTAAALSYYLIERPFLRLKRGWQGRPAPAIAPLKAAA
jgi:peptidoglycan/LPS O-acetylase OafA/YrhL